MTGLLWFGLGWVGGLASVAMAVVLVKVGVPDGPVSDVIPITPKAGRVYKPSVVDVPLMPRAGSARK